MSPAPGLQPERTAMSWLRTQLVLFVLGVLVFKIAQSMEWYLVCSVATFCMCFSIGTSLYTRLRFTQLFHNEMTLQSLDVWVKKALCAVIVLLVLSYFTLMWWRYLS